MGGAARSRPRRSHDRQPANAPQGQPLDRIDSPAVWVQQTVSASCYSHEDETRAGRRRPTATPPAPPSAAARLSGADTPACGRARPASGSRCRSSRPPCSRCTSAAAPRSCRSAGSAAPGLRRRRRRLPHHPAHVPRCLLPCCCWDRRLPRLAGPSSGRRHRPAVAIGPCCGRRPPRCCCQRCGGPRRWWRLPLRPPQSVAPRRAGGAGCEGR
jgi:hypothetical protein